MNKPKQKLSEPIKAFLKSSKTKLTYMKLLHFLLNKTPIQTKQNSKTAKITKAPRSKKQKKI